MSISANTLARAPATLHSPERSYVWMTVLILLGVAACTIAASFYAGAAVIDPSLVGP
jgi:hypothetical protein